MRVQPISYTLAGILLPKLVPGGTQFYLAKLLDKIMRPQMTTTDGN